VAVSGKYGKVNVPNIGESELIFYYLRSLKIINGGDVMIEWEETIDICVNKAKREGKPILMDFFNPQ
jgi:hypothetical protein